LRAQLTDLAGPQGKALAKARRTKEQFQRQVEALQNVNRILARRESGIQAEQIMPTGPGSLGETPPVLQSIQELSGQSNVLKQYAQRLREAKIQARGLAQAVQDTELAGSDRELGRVPEGARQAGEEIDDTVNRQLTQGIQLASQLGATLIESAEQGGASFQQIFGSVLQTIGGIVGVANPAAGAAISGGGTIIQQLQHGGTVQSALQIVGEEGPELAALPKGTQVASHDASMRIMEQKAARQMTVEIEEQGRLRSNMDRLRADIDRNAEFKGR
jgi:hypothetical protein